MAKWVEVSFYGPKLRVVWVAWATLPDLKEPADWCM